MKQLLQILVEERKCSECDSKKTAINKSGIQYWYRNPLDSTQWLCHKCYNKTPKRMEQRRIYRERYEQTPFFKERRKRVHNTPKHKDYMKEYKQRPEYKIKNAARMREYYSTPEGHANLKRNLASRRSRLQEVCHDLTASQWRKILEYFGGFCAYCLRPLGKDISQDHVIPLARQGAHTEANVVPAHSVCNKSKSARSLWLLPNIFDNIKGVF